ncbi:hypothetical protein DEO23_01495 [Brachybacterium endophyticum]|uniref:DUF5134 domain-containing protein n=1 Tax=Brachybacterium endophyticum TaxID=2182385 RepID=A0A2U2RNA9_9MICO|nr:DUF5134 domain-containing protein [Brachybacterium endophyticum]PWH07350.1 hypothetical protein DEO23_01495 [Brachybacterium endophyticum]
MGGMTGTVVLTVLFATLGVHALVSAVRHRARPFDLVGDLLHALMCVGMVAMSWPWWSLLPSLPQILLYALAAGWFVLLALLQIARGTEAVAQGADGQDIALGHGHGPLHQLQHAVMMLAMVWMVVVMSPGGGAGHDGGHQMAMLSPAQSLLGIVFTAALAVSGLLVLAQAREAAPGRTGLLAMAAMDLAMASACWPMLLQ